MSDFCTLFPSLSMRFRVEWTVWSLLEIFVNMDIARISELSADQCLKAFDPVPWNMGVDRPGDISYGEYDAKR